MRHFTRSIFLVFLLITCFSIKAQAPPTQAPVLLNVQGKIFDDDGDVLNGGIITVTQGGRTVSTITTGSDGKYSFQLPLGGDYMVTVSKSEMITKKFSISTRGIPPERALESFGVVDAQISLWKKVEGVDYSALNQPANKYTYFGDKQNFDYDKGYLEQMQGVIAGIREQEKAIEKKNKDLEKNYQAAIKEGDKSFSKKDYQGALAKYNEALGLKKEDAVAKQKIEQTNQAMKADADAALAAKKKAEDEAALAAKKKADEAAALAAKKKADDDAALAAKKKAEDEAALVAKKKIDDDNKGKATATVRGTLGGGGNDVQYRAAIVRGDNNLKFKQYKDAVSAYTEALTYKPNDPNATTKLALAQKNLVSDVDTNKVAAKKEPNPLTLKYPQGVTEETLPGKGFVEVRRILVKGDDAWVYRKRIFNWGGVQCYKDDVTIAPGVWESETK